MVSLNLSLCILSFLSHLAIVSSYTGWVEPPSDHADLYRTYYLGDTVYVTWSNISYARVRLRITYWDVDQDTTISLLLDNEPNQDGTSWQIGKNDNITLAKIADPKFCLRLSDGAGLATTFISRGFLILPPKSSSATTSTAPATGSSTSTLTVTATPTSSSATAPATSKPSAGMSEGAKVGIGVGVPLGGLLVASWVFFILRRRKRPTSTSAVRPMVYSGASNGSFSYMSGQHQPHGELQGHTPEREPYRELQGRTQEGELYGEPRF